MNQDVHGAHIEGSLLATAFRFYGPAETSPSPQHPATAIHTLDGRETCGAPGAPAHRVSRASLEAGSKLSKDIAARLTKGQYPPKN